MNKSLTLTLVPPDNIADATCHDFFDWSDYVIQDKHQYEICVPSNSVAEGKSLDKSSLMENRQTLGRLLSNRRSISELVEQGIMLDAAKVSPTHADQFRRSEWMQTSDKLQIKIQQRPKRSSLVEQNILDDENPLVSPLLIERQKALKKCQLADRLNYALCSRPGALDLVKNGVLPSSDPKAQSLINDTIIVPAVHIGSRRQRAMENGSEICAVRPSKKMDGEDLSVSNQQVVKFGNLVFHNFVPPSKCRGTKNSNSNHDTQSNFDDSILTSKEALPMNEVEQDNYSTCSESTNLRSQLLMSELTEEIRKSGFAQTASHKLQPPQLTYLNKSSCTHLPTKITNKCGQPPLLLPNGPLPLQQQCHRPVITALERLTVTQLKAECRELGLRYNGLNKRDLQRLLQAHRTVSLVEQPSAPPPQLSLTTEQLQALMQQFHIQQLQQQEQQWQARLNQIKNLSLGLRQADRQVLEFLPTLSAHYSSASSCNSSSSSSSSSTANVLQKHFQELTRCADKLREQLSETFQQEQQNLQVEFQTALSQSNTHFMEILQQRHSQLMLLLQEEEEALSQQQQHSNPSLVIVRERSLTMPNGEPNNESFQTGQRSLSEPCSSHPKQFDDYEATAMEQINTNETLNLINEILAAGEPQLPQLVLNNDQKLPASPMHVDLTTAAQGFANHNDSMSTVAPNHFLFPEDLREILRPILSSGADMRWSGFGAQPSSSACMSGNSVTVDLLTPRTQEVMFSDLSNVMMDADADNDSVFVESV